MGLRRRKTPVVKMCPARGGQTADPIGRRLAWHIDQLADVNSDTGGAHQGQQRGSISMQTVSDIDVLNREVVAVARCGRDSDGL